MRADYHMHSHISADCDTPMVEQLKAAAAAGLQEICFTDHFEYNYPKQYGFTFEVDIDEYRNTVKNLPDLGVKVKFGAEAGLCCAEKDNKKLAEIIRSGNFDFVIASGHLIENVDPYFPGYYETRTVEYANREYVECLYKYLNWYPDDCYCAIGHVDFGAKFNPDKTAQLHYKHCPDQLDALFKYAIERGKCIEINTSTYRRFEKDYPGDWLKRYREMGGDFVTFGGDAHYTHHVGYKFDVAVDMAKAAGIRYYATFDGMKPTMHRL